RPPRRGGEAHRGGAGGARAALRRRQPGARLLLRLRRPLVSQHEPLRAQVARAAPGRGAAVGGGGGHAAARSAGACRRGAPRRRAGRRGARLRPRPVERVAGMALTAAILVTWNSAEHLPRCLDALRAQTVPLQLIHVDNASSDDSVTIVRDRFPGCVQMVNHTNRGFAAAVNQALAHAHGELVLLCNPDAFLAPDYVARIGAALESGGESFGMATGKLLRAGVEGMVDSKGIRMTRTGRHLDIGQGLPDETDALHEVFGV